MKIKKSIPFIILAVFIILCSMMSVTTKGKHKLKKPIYVVAESDSELFSIKATDNYDNNIHIEMHAIEGKMGTVSFETHIRESNTTDSVYVEKYRGIYEKKLVFFRKGCEPSDTLYSWHVPLVHAPNTNREIMVNNEGNNLKVFCDCHAKSISVSTLDKKIIAEKTVDGRLTEFSIPNDVKYLTISIHHGDAVNSLYNENTVFFYPVR